MLNNRKDLRDSKFCCNQVSMFQRPINSVIQDECGVTANFYNEELTKIKFDAELIINY